MNPCVSTIFDIGPNLLLLLLQLLTLGGTALSLYTIRTSARAIQAVARSPILNGGNPHPPREH